VATRNGRNSSQFLGEACISSEVGEPDYRADPADNADRDVRIGEDSNASDSSRASAGDTVHNEISEVVDPFLTVKSVMRGGKFPWGLTDDPAWKKYPRAMHFLCNRTTDGIQSREIPRLTLSATPDGFTVTVSDYTLSYAVFTSFQHIEELLPALEKAIQKRSCWKPIKVGDGYAKRKAEEKKKLDEAKEKKDNMS
jgi:hypothetical protein